jgi:hypothetical protein
MPGQNFLDPYTGQVVVSLSWDMGERAVDVDAGGTLLTRVTDIAGLKEAGMQGQTPHGEFLSIRSVPGASGLRFEVTKNDIHLEAGHVNFGIAGPRLDAPAAALNSMHTTARPDGLAFDKKGRLTQGGKVIDTRALGGDKVQKVDKGSLTSGRLWIGIFAVLNTLPFLFFAGVFLLAAKQAGQDNNLSVAGLAIGIWIFAFVAALFLSPWWVSFGLTFHKTRPSMGFRMGLGVFWISYLLPLGLAISSLSHAHAGLVAYAGLGFAMMPFTGLTYLAHRSLTKSIAAADAIRHNLTQVAA